MFVLASGITTSVLSGVVAYQQYGPYGERQATDPRVRRTYDAQGQPTGIAIDTNGDLRLDSWAHLEDGRIVRVDSDRDGDGRPELREFFDDRTRLTRLEVLDREGRVTRREWYDDGVLTRSESLTEATSGAPRP